MTTNVIGNIGKDAVLRKVNINNVETSVCDFWMAENIRKRNGDQKTAWYKVTIWRGFADSMAKYLKKGREVYVTGTVEAKFYTDENNVIRPYINIQASEIHLSGKKPENDVPPDIAPDPADAPEAAPAPEVYAAPATDTASKVTEVAEEAKVAKADTAAPAEEDFPWA